MVKLLIVDDELDFCDYLGRILSREGYDVIKATSGREALDKVRIEKPHLILLDFLMPKMDGIETLRRIKHIDKNIIVIMVTVVNDGKVAEKAIKLGAVNYITKPIDLDLLKRNIRNWARKVEENQLSKIDIIALDYDKKSFTTITNIFTKKGYKIKSVDKNNSDMQVKGPIDFLILRADIIGDEAVRVLSKYRQVYSKLPIMVAVKSESADELINKMRHFGSCHYLPPSFALFDVLSIIYRMLDKTENKGRTKEKKKQADYILIVDDEPDICEYAGKYLSREGYNICSLTNSKDVLEKVKASKPSIVLLDIIMPGVDGLELLRKIKKIYPKIEVIMMTGVKDESVWKECVESGACDCIIKPFSLEQLKATVFTNVIKFHLSQ